MCVCVEFFGGRVGLIYMGRGQRDETQLSEQLIATDHPAIHSSNIDRAEGKSGAAQYKEEEKHARTDARMRAHTQTQRQPCKSTCPPFSLPPSSSVYTHSHTHTPLAFDGELRAPALAEAAALTAEFISWSLKRRSNGAGEQENSE